MNSRFVLPVVGFAILSNVSPGLAQQKRTTGELVGFINDVAGSCWLKTSSSLKRVTRNEFVGHALHVGDKVRCDKGGLLSLELRSPAVSLSDAKISTATGVTRRSCSGCTTIDPSPPDKWTVIRKVSLVRSDPLAAAVDDWFKLAGGVRSGTRSPVYSPPSGSPGGSVRPDSLVIRWISETASGNISLQIQDELGNPVWPPRKDTRATLPAAVQELASADLRKALMTYQASGNKGLLTLTFVNSTGDESQVQFSLLSSDQEGFLRNELTVCDAQEGLIMRVCRAYTFRRLGLYCEAAEEYDIAMRDLAPNSVELALHAIVANRRTGNHPREETIRQQLPIGVKPPD
jgi:hypothetical protein